MFPPHRSNPFHLHVTAVSASNSKMKTCFSWWLSRKVCYFLMVCILVMFHTLYWCVNSSADLCVCTNVCAMCTVAVAHVFIVGDGNALLGVLWDLPLAMHGGAGRHAPITSLWSKLHANSAPPQSTQYKTTTIWVDNVFFPSTVWKLKNCGIHFISGSAQIFL